jgi:selenocysteine lyase/cysteine desulfurase
MNSDSTTATPDDISSHTRLTCQKHLFSLEPGAKYLNCAAYSPFMVASKEAGVRAMEIKSNPQHISSQHHFTDSAILRSKYAELINEGDADRIAIFPSVSYGMAIVANNLHRLPGVSTKRSLLILESEFPNDTYAFERVAKDLNLSIDVVKMCDDISQLGDKWNESLLEQIQEGTAAVIVPHVHWIYGNICVMYADKLQFIFKVECDEIFCNTMFSD